MSESVEGHDKQVDKAPASAPVSGSALPMERKVNLHLRSVGDAPALKQQKFKLDCSKCVVEVDKFLKKTLKVSNSLYLYCGSGFSPTPDQRLVDLFDNFQIGGELVISYGLQEAWG